MQRISSLQQALIYKFLVVSLALLATISSFIYIAPSYAGTYAEQKLVPPQEALLTPEEKIERAYEISESAGRLEEAKQASQNANTLTDPNEKANIKVVTTPKNEQNLVEKIIEKVKGDS